MANLEQLKKDIGEGLDGENVIRRYLESKGIKYIQADLIFKGKDKYILAEVKHQEIFEKSKYKYDKGGFENIPFDGHGLPPWQVEARIKFCKELDMIPYLFVVDKKTNIIYHESLIVLKTKENRLTKGGKRIIFNIESFKILNNGKE